MSVIPSRSETILKFRQLGGSIAAVLPIHSPRALLRAFRILPVEIWGPPYMATHADHAWEGAAHLQPYVCSIARNALSFILSGGLERNVDFIIVPHACDSLQGLGSLLIDFIHPEQPVFPLYLPRGRRDSDLHFLVEELRVLYQRLEAATGRSPGESELMQAVLLEETADNLLVKLHQCRMELPLKGIEMYRLIRSREYLPAEVFSDIAQAALDQAETGRQPPGFPILLSGIVPEPMSLFNTIEENGGWVAADDLASCGRRLYPPGRSQDPFLRMAERLQSAPPDPMRGSRIDERLAHLLRLFNTTGARGIVFYEVKFCEPELFHLPVLRRRLQEAGLRSLTLEVDLSEGLSEQAVTRLGAFLETLK